MTGHTQIESLGTLQPATAAGEGHGIALAGDGNAAAVFRGTHAYALDPRSLLAGNG